MINRKKVLVVLPAYNAEKTLEITYADIPFDIVDEVLLVDDSSSDSTVSKAKDLGIKVFLHDRNYGYGRNQKTCYHEALKREADIIVMVHPDYQYTPLLVPAMASIIGNGLYHCILGSRILGGYARQGGMPLWKYVSNRFLTFSENLLTGAKLSEYHTGYRAFSRQLLEKIDLDSNSDDFVFDNQMLLQVLWHGYLISEVSCPTKYFPEASSIDFLRSVKYGFGCLWNGLKYRLSKLGLMQSKLFKN